MNLDELYFKDNFTKEEDKTNLSINRLEAECITSKSNKFSLDEEGILTVKNIHTIDPIISNFYPIGSIYMSINDTNPSTLFGGIWEQIKGKFLFGCDNEILNGTIGGEKEHALSIYEIPGHNHTCRTYSTNYNQNISIPNGRAYAVSFKTNEGCLAFNSSNQDITGGELCYMASTDNVGGDQPHNNMPPYLAIYIWKRVG